MKISVCIPTYKGLDYIDDCIKSILMQDYENFEINVCNDSASDHDEMGKALKKYNDPRIQYHPNETRLGYPLNMRKAVGLANGVILFLMAQDDVILEKTLFSQCLKIFEENPEVGVITRPYYWFEEDVWAPIRIIPKCDKRIISCDDDGKYIRAVLETVGQFSGLVLKKELVTHRVNEHVFPAHIYPFLSVMRTHKCYFMDNFTIAVRTSSSQTRFLSTIYRPSPTKTWVNMFYDVFPEDKYKHIRETGIDHITINYVGLVQIKNYGYYKDLLSDIYYMTLYRKKNLLSVKFWIYVIAVLIIPRFILRRMVDFYKNKVNKFFLRNLI